MSWATNEIEELLVQSASKEKFRSIFYHNLLKEMVYVLVRQVNGYVGTHSPKRVTVHPEEDLEFLTCTDLNGVVHFPVFTSLQRISDYVHDEHHYLALKGLDLFSIIQNKSPKGNVVLNPNSPYSVLWTGDELKKMIRDHK